jgi:hypothetical protein
MESQLLDGCDTINIDKESILSLWLDQLSPPTGRSSETLPSTTRAPRPSPADIQTLETCACRGCLSAHVGPGTDTDPGANRRVQRRKRRWARAGMDDSDSVSVASSSRILANRPILEPTPPSTKRTTRTPSPTRKLLTLLEHARPPLKCCQPGNAVGTLPDRVVALRRHLAKDLGKSCIPREFRVRCPLQHCRRHSLTELSTSNDFVTPPPTNSKT